MTPAPHNKRHVALVTGASAGIGHATAIALHEQGFTVYTAARRVDRMSDLRAQGIRPLALDVTDEASARDAIHTIQREAGRLDVLVNNAGYGSYGAVEDVSLAEGQRQFDVNVFGAIRLIKLVTPLMREQRSGRIVNVTSVGGKIYTPFGAWYHGSKFALEGMSDVLRIELQPFGIDVIVIEPGAVKSEWASIAGTHLLETSGHGVYAAAACRLSESLMSGPNAERASDPSVIATTITRAVTARRPRARYAAGYAAHIVLLLRRLLPDRALDRIVMHSVR